MCGRIATDFGWIDVKEEFEVDKVLSEFSPHYNIPPTREIPVIVAGSTAFDTYYWGLIPHWAKDKSTAMANARCETITEKPWFKEAFLSSRCLILVSGFYEWDKSKNPHYIQIPGKKVFAIAGIASSWSPKTSVSTKTTKESKAPKGTSISNVKPLKTCAIITTDANVQMSKIHHRMPLIIDKKDYVKWIDPSNQDIELLKKMLIPFKGKIIDRVVSKEVNFAKNDYPDLLKEIKQAKL